MSNTATIIACKWFFIGFLIAVVWFKTIPQIKVIRAENKAKRKRIKKYPSATIIKPQFNYN